MGLIQQSMTIFGISAILALIVAFAHPKAPLPPWLETADAYAVTPEMLEGYIDLVWVDARSAEAYEGEQAPGAIRLNEDNWDEAFFSLLERWTPNQSIVVYCDASGCQASEAVAQRLRRELDFESVYYLQGGWDALKEHVR